MFDWILRITYTFNESFISIHSFMLTLVNDSKKVNAFYKEFLKLLKSKELFPNHLKPFRLGFKGGEAADEAYYSPKLKIWASPGWLGWNAFGLDEVPSMVIQINFQDYDGKPQRRGAAFALDEAGEPVVVHRGHIGGGRPGIGLSLMLNECRAERVVLEEDGLESECFVVGQLRSKFFTQQLADFVREVDRVKNLTTVTESGLSGVANSLFKLDDSSLTKEKVGTHNRTKGGAINLTHGLVINALAEYLKPLASKRDWQIRNDRHRDLMLLNDGGLSVLFEVKTTVTSQSVCTALGQLLLYSAYSPKAKLILVLPEVLAKDVVNQLERWNVSLLYYKWRDTKPHFQQLKKLLNRL